MSLFKTLSDMSRTHAENSADAGQYDYTAPLKDYSEPAPTVSLYNLLDHSVDALEHFRTVLYLGIAKLDSFKLVKSDTYTDACALARILEAAIREKKDRDSEAWAEKTAKEITNQTK